MRKQPQQHRRSGRIPHNLSVLPADFAWLRAYGGGVASDGLALAVSTLRSQQALMRDQVKKTLEQQ